LNAAHQQLISELTDTSPTDFAKQTIDRLSLKEFMERSGLPDVIVKSGLAAGFLNPPPKLYIDPSEFRSRDDLGDLAEFCAVANLKTVDDLEDALNRVLSESENFFQRLVSKNRTWWAETPFLIELLIILANPKSFSADLLKSAFNWDESIAQLVMQAVSPSVAKKNAERKQNKNKT